MCFGRASPREPLGDVWLFAAGRWRELEIEGPTPPPRWSHTLTASGATHILVGGRDDNTVFGDLWVLGGGWTRLADGTVPVFAHTATRVDDRLVVFGGVGATRPRLLRDHRLDECGGPDASVFAHVAAEVGGGLLVVGGVDRSQDASSRASLFGLEHDELQLVKDQPKLPPDVLPVHAAVVALRPDLVLVIGGGAPCFAFSPIFGASFALEAEVNKGF